MDASLLTATYSTPWFIAIIDELVDTLHQSYPDANWTNLPSLTSEVFVAKPQILHVRAASCTTAQGNGNANSNGSGNNNNSNGNNNSNANGSTNSNDSSKSGGNNTALIAAVAGAVGGCLLLACIIFFFYRRHVKRKHAAPQSQAPAPNPNPTLLDSTPLAAGKAQPMHFQGGPMAMATPPSTYVPSSSGDSSSQYNYTAPLSPQWTGTTGATSTYLGHPRPPSLHPSTYYTTSSAGPHPMTSSASVAGPAPWAVPMDPNLQPHPQAYLSPSPSIIAHGPSPSPGTEKSQFSGYAVPVHQNALPAWAVDHKRPGALSGPPSSAGASGSGTGASLSNVLEQPGDALPPPAYSATPSSL